MLRIDKHQWRVYLLHRRIHHGLVGTLMALAGIALAWHDRRDFPFRLRD